MRVHAGAVIESLRNGRLAQRLAQVPYKHKIGGSNPSSPTIDLKKVTGNVPVAFSLLGPCFSGFFAALFWTLFERVVSVLHCVRAVRGARFDLRVSGGP